MQNKMSEENSTELNSGKRGISKERLGTATTQDSYNGRPKPQDAVVILLDSMLAHSRDETLQARAILSLIRMSENETERDLIGESGCLEAAMTAMRNFPSSSKLLCRICMLLEKVSSGSVENKRKIRRCRGIEELTTLMSRRDFDEDVQCAACQALMNLTEDCIENQLIAGSCGTPEVLQRVVKRFDWNKALHVAGIATIGNIAYGGLDNQKKLRDCGCIDAIVDSMKRFSQSVSVQERCVVAIKTVCKDNSKNQRTIRELGAVDLLTEILRKDKSRIQLIIEVCSTFRYLCFEENIREDLGRNGALVLLLDMLGHVSKNGDINGVETVLKALTNATFGPDENKEVVIRCSGIANVLEVLTVWEDEANIIESGLRVFRNVSEKSSVSCQLRDTTNVYEYALTKMESFPDHAGITEQSFATVMNGIQQNYDEERIGMSISRLQEVVQRQLKNLPTSIPVQKLGRDLLKRLEAIESFYSEATSRKKRSRVLPTFRWIGSGQGRD